MTRKSADYWEGYNAEAARNARPSHFESLAQQVSRALGRDNGRKQKIFARSPGIFSSMDAEELGRMSSTEMAARELKALGIDPGDNDPVAILDAHHAGRRHALDYQIPGNRLVGGNEVAIPGNKLLGGSASDAREGGSFIDRYIHKGEEK